MTVPCDWHLLTERDRDRCSDPPTYRCTLAGPDDLLWMCSRHTHEASRRINRMVAARDLPEICTLLVEPLAEVRA